MPIRFRCTFCNRLLGIATRKAGTETTCPHCGFAIAVPFPEESNKTERLNLDDVDQLLGNHATERMTEPGTQVLAPPPEPPKPAPPTPKARPVELPAPSPLPPVDPDDPPLFENDVDDLFGPNTASIEKEHPRRPRATGKDALSLDEPQRVLVLSAQKATLLVCGVVVLLALAFAAGYFSAR